MCKLHHQIIEFVKGEPVLARSILLPDRHFELSCLRPSIHELGPLKHLHQIRFLQNQGYVVLLRSLGNHYLTLQIEEATQAVLDLTVSKVLLIHTRTPSLLHELLHDLPPDIVGMAESGVGSEILGGVIALFAGAQCLPALDSGMADGSVS